MVGHERCDRLPPRWREVSDENSATRSPGQKCKRVLGPLWPGLTSLGIGGVKGSEQRGWRDLEDAGVGIEGG